jgi:BirA family biotin operon repressor/biotin-[acetyl-CoA-carboxylase] ligase
MLDLKRLRRETFVARVEHHETIGSTNDRAKECAGLAAGPRPWLIVADVQTAGRGRGSNRWWTGPGSLAFSLLLAEGSVDPRSAGGPLLGLGAAVAIAETVAPLLVEHAVGLHWPNDVFAAGRKLGGVLVEVLPDRKAVVGIGLNTNSAPGDVPAAIRDTATTLLELTGGRCDHTDMLVVLLRRLEAAIATLADRPAEIAARADHLCLQRDRLLAVRCGAETVTGRCAGIAPDGALLLETGCGGRALRSGVVRVLPPS